MTIIDENFSNKSYDSFALNTPMFEIDYYSSWLKIKFPARSYVSVAIHLKVANEIILSIRKFPDGWGTNFKKIKNFGESSFWSPRVVKSFLLKALGIKEDMRD